LRLRFNQYTRARTGFTDWKAIAVFYDQLARLWPTLGGDVARAAAHAEVDGAASGLALLEGIDPESVASYQPYWAVRAHLLQQLNRTHDAAEAYDRAIGLAQDEAVRGFLLARQKRVSFVVPE